MTVPAPNIPLSVHAAQARALVAALREAGITDDESVEISLESQTDLPTALGEAVRQLDELDAMQVALDRLADNIGVRKARLRERSERIRGAVLSALELAGVPSCPTPLGTVSLIAPKPGVRILDEALIPVEFVRSKTTTSPDKAAISRALMAGVAVPGAVLGNGAPSLRITR